MRVFFTDRSNVTGDMIILDSDNEHHIKNVLRLKPGTMINVKTGGNVAYSCRIREFSDAGVICDIKTVEESDTELPVRVCIYQGLPKRDKLETVIQKCTELGAVRIVPVITERTVVKLDEKKAKSKCERWNKIAVNASEQSRRSVVCEVGMPVTFTEAVAEAGEFDHFILPFECAEGFDKTREVFAGIKHGESVALFIGPEGGFSDGEVSLAEENGAVAITLGKRILRTETAAMYVLSVLGFLLEK